MKIKVLEVMHNGNVSYLGAADRISKQFLVSSPTAAINFEIEEHARQLPRYLKMIRIPGDTIFSMMSFPADAIALVDIEVQVQELSRSVARAPMVSVSR